jgi:hypothetical protein
LRTLAGPGIATDGVLRALGRAGVFSIDLRVFEATILMFFPFRASFSFSERKLGRGAGATLSGEGDGAFGSFGCFGGLPRRFGVGFPGEASAN